LNNRYMSTLFNWI